MGRRFLINTAVLVVALVIVSAVIIAAMNVPERGGAAGQSFFDQFIVAGGPIVWFVLMPMSFLTIFLVAEHFITIRRKKLLPEGTGKEVVEVIRQFGPQQLETRIKDRQDFVSIAAVKAVTQGRGDWFRMRSALDESLQEQSWALVRKIEWLNLIGNVSPMVGLFGTVFGMIKLFNAIVVAGGQPQPAQLADGISVALTNDAIKNGLEDEVADRIRETWPVHEDDVFTKTDQLELIRQETVLAEIFYLAVGSVSMFIGMLFVATIMIVSVLERTREIGMLRAIGLSRRTVFNQVLTESMILVLLGALIGIAPGYYGAVWAAGRISEDVGVDIALGFSTGFVVQALFWILVVGALFAMYPAYVAVRMNIVRAITSSR